LEYIVGKLLENGKRLRKLREYAVKARYKYHNMTTT
jgi:hypothetical protein